jgi:hypothetical protein
MQAKFKLMMRFAAIFAIFVALALAPLLSAQRSAASAHAAAPAVRNSAPPGSLFGRNSHPSGSHRFSAYASPYASLPFPFFGDGFTLDDIYSTGYPVASEPPPFLMQAVRDRAGSPDSVSGAMARSGYDRSASPSQPLMIELQNGRYVHVSTSAIDGEALPLTSESAISKPLISKPQIAAASPAPDLAPAVLIFRDGHSEQVRDYTIANGILYARGDYYTDGYWNKKINLATLDIAQTQAANSARNVTFTLPSFPNEVIARF